MDLLTVCKEYTNAQLDEELIEVSVPELEDFNFWIKPIQAVSVSVMDKVVEGRNMGNVTGLIEVLAARALDENARPLIKSAAQKAALKKQVSAHLIASMVQQINAIDHDTETASVEDTKKS